MDKGDRRRGGEEVVKRGDRQEEEGEIEWGKRSRQGLVEPKAPRR